MLMSVEILSRNLLFINGIQGLLLRQIGLFECELGLIEYLQNRKMGLFEYNGAEQNKYSITYCLILL